MGYDGNTLELCMGKQIFPLFLKSFDKMYTLNAHLITIKSLFMIHAPQLSVHSHGARVKQHIDYSFCRCCADARIAHSVATFGFHASKWKKKKLHASTSLSNKILFDQITSHLFNYNHHTHTSLPHWGQHFRIPSSDVRLPFN